MGGDIGAVSCKYGSLVLLVVIGAAPALAGEPGDYGQYVPGTSFGIPTGAAPPPGLYYDNLLIWVPGANGVGQLNGLKVNAVANLSTLFWSTGWNFLGGSVSAAVSQPVFDLGVQAPPFGVTTHYPTLHNTWISPLIVSWNLGAGWFASAGAAFYPDNGTKSNNTPNPDYWTFDPHASVSYLADGWDLTAYLIYEINAASAGRTGAFAGTPFAAFGVGYRSGDLLIVDFTATKKFGPWEIGPVAFAKWQTTEDRPGAGASCDTMAVATFSLLTCGRSDHLAIGGLVGYDFGSLALRLIAAQCVYARDDVRGLSVSARVTFRLWGPDAPTPPATKPQLIHK
jgi:hypothetical protein